MRVLAVDDDPNDLRYVRDVLIDSGYAPVVTGDPKGGGPPHGGGEARAGAAGPDASGDRRDRADEGHPGRARMCRSSSCPPTGGEDVVVRAFEMGATDYIVKPFSPSELSARINAALRRRVAAEPSEPYILGDLTIDYALRRVTLVGRQVELTPMEYGMLAELAAHAGTGGDARSPDGTGLEGQGRRKCAAHTHHGQQDPRQVGRRRT